MFKFKKKSSEQNWKKKAIERNEENKKLKKKIDELTRSRNKWKDKATNIKKELYQVLKKKIQEVKKNQKVINIQL